MSDTFSSPFQEGIFVNRDRMSPLDVPAVSPTTTPAGGGAPRPRIVAHGPAWTRPPTSCAVQCPGKDFKA